MQNEEYNGWTNHATWNVALWIGGDEGIYKFAQGFNKYADFVAGLKEVSEGRSLAFQTPDGVSWTDSGLNHAELDEIFTEFHSNH